VKRYVPHLTISGAALVVAATHALWPNVKIDASTMVLLLIAVLPWLGFIFKSVELPGGLRVEYPELQKAREEADEAGLLAEPAHEQPAYLSVFEDDPNLALAGLRIEIERCLRGIAEAKNIPVGRASISRLLRILREHNALSQQDGAVLSDLLGLLNSAVHGAEVDPRAAQWAMEVGPRLLAGLHKRAQG
jgi:hypothetical protein